MGLEVFVGLLIGLLSAGMGIAGALSGDNEGSGESILLPASSLLMPPSTSSSVVTFSFHHTSIVLSASQPTTTLLLVTPTPSSSSSTPPPSTPSPTLSSSSSLQFPSSALLLGVSSPSSSSSVFTLQPVITPSLTDHIVSTPSPLPSSPLPPTGNFNSSEPTAPHSSVGIPQGVVLAGPIVGGVVVVVVLPLIVIAVCVVLRRRKKNGKHSLRSARKDFYIITADDDKNQQEHTKDLPSTSNDKILNYGITTDTFGISSKDKTLDFPDMPAREGGGDLPALIFINAVDPTIPVSSNTLPMRRKAKVNSSGIDLRSYFDGLSSSKDSLRKGYKSTGSINKINDGSAEKLLTPDCSLQLQELNKQKASSNNLHSPRNDDSITTSLMITNDGIEPKTSDSYRYLFMEPRDGSAMSPSKEQPESKGLCNVPKGLLQMPLLTETSLNDSSPRIKFEASTTDTSHYDVPKRLLEAREKLVAGSAGSLGDTPKEVTNMPKKEKEEKEAILDAKKDASSMVNQTDIIREPQSGMQESPTKPTTSLTKLDEKPPSSVSKPEGIYDVPRTLLTQCAVEPDSVTINQANVRGVSGRTKPKITPRAPTTKISSDTKTEGIYDFPRSILLHSSEPVIKPDVDSVGKAADALTLAYQKSSAGNETSTEAVIIVAQSKPQLKPKPKDIPPSKDSGGSVKPPVPKVKPVPPPRRTATQKQL